MKNFTDPGHGGADSGAIGLNKVKESDIVLDICKKIDKYLEPCNIDNVMSRDRDITLALVDRSRKANNINADTLVSVHCNSFTDPKSKGLEIIYMSKNGKKLAETIVSELKKQGLYTVLRHENTGLKYQNVHICRETTPTACLVELGFITNIDDYNLIMNNKDKFAKAIAKSICIYNKVSFVDVATNIPKPTVTNFENGEYSGQYAIVTTDTLNVRYDRGTNNKVINTLKKGDKVRLGYCLNKWIAIHGFKGNKGFGYVHTDYLKLV